MQTEIPQTVLEQLLKLVQQWEHFHAADRPGMEDYDQRDSYGLDILAKLEKPPLVELLEASEDLPLPWAKRDRWNARKFAKFLISKFLETTTQITNS